MKSCGRNSEIEAPRMDPFEGLLSLADVLDTLGVKYWLDSGLLLGCVREGGEIAWDSDIDLGMWADDTEKVLRSMPALRNSGLSVSYRRYRGLVYGFTIKDRRRNDLRPIHIHVYFRSEELAKAWSPQTVTFKRGFQRKGVDNGFAAWPNIRMTLAFLNEEARRRHEPAPVPTSLLRWGVYYPVWGALVLLRKQFDREGWASIWPYSTYYALYTWMIPESHFLELDSLWIGGVEFRVPANVESYLEARYGKWQTPVRDWCYWTDDGCIFPHPPEVLVPDFPVRIRA